MASKEVPLDSSDTQHSDSVRQSEIHQILWNVLGGACGMMDGLFSDWLQPKSIHNILGNHGAGRAGIPYGDELLLRGFWLSTIGVPGVRYPTLVSQKS